jgi:hypothetical protein
MNTTTQDDFGWIGRGALALLAIGVTLMIFAW